MDGTILVADDDRTIRTVLTQALTRAGCKVHATSSLVTLMRWVEEGKGDLVISDVIMPDGNGLEQLPKIAEARPGLPVIVISAQNTIMTAIQAAEAEAYDYLPKPFDLPDLMKRAARALEIKRRAPARREVIAVARSGRDVEDNDGALLTLGGLAGAAARAGLAPRDRVATAARHAAQGVLVAGDILVDGRLAGAAQPVALLGLHNAAAAAVGARLGATLEPHTLVVAALVVA